MPCVRIARAMLGIVADRQQAAMHLRMQRLDPAVHHFGKAGEFGDVDAPSARRPSAPWRCRRSRPVRRRGRQARWAKSTRPVLSETESRARVMRRGWLGHGRSGYVAHQAGGSVFASAQSARRIHGRCRYSGSSGSSARPARRAGGGGGRVAEAPVHARRPCGHGRRSRSAGCGAGRPGRRDRRFPRARPCRP